MSARSSADNTFRIEPREPRLVRRIADGAMAAVRQAGLLPFEPETIDRLARRSSGLEDLRPDEVAEPLALFCDDVRNHPPTPLGHTMMLSILVQAMASRRRLQHANAPAQPDSPPIVIAGWYRTGTTFLQTLLGSLPGSAYVPLHKLVDPVPVSSSKLVAEISSRWAHHLEPDLGRLHNTNSMTPEECWLLLGKHMILDGMVYMYPLPTYRQWLEEADRLPAYEAWAKAAGILERRMQSRLVLKDPAHMRGFRELLTVSPDSKIVWTHRDPKDAVASHASLVAVQHRLMYGDLDEASAGRECVDGFRRYFASAREAREELGEGPFIDVHFPDLKDDPIGTVERICDAAGWPFEAAPLERLLEERKHSSKQRHERNLAQWGISPEEIVDYY